MLCIFHKNSLIIFWGNQTNTSNRSKRIAEKGSQLIGSCDKKAYSKQHVMLYERRHYEGCLYVNALNTVYTPSYLNTVNTVVNYSIYTLIRKYSKYSSKYIIYTLIRKYSKYSSKYSIYSIYCIYYCIYCNLQ